MCACGCVCVCVCVCVSLIFLFLSQKIYFICYLDRIEFLSLNQLILKIVSVNIQLILKIINQLILKILPRRYYSFIWVCFLSESSFSICISFLYFLSFKFFYMYFLSIFPFFQVFLYVFSFLLWQKHRVRCNLSYDYVSVFQQANN